MCLSKLEPSAIPVKKGYVVVHKTKKGNYRPQIHYHYALSKKMGEYVPLVAYRGKWHRADERMGPISANGFTYGAGFHVWHTIEAAKKWGRDENEVIVEVEVNDVIAVGYQKGELVTVARERKIIREVK